MFDTAGSRLNFSVVAGVQESFRVSFYSGGNGMSVLGATFNAACYTAHGDEAGSPVAVLPVQHDSAAHKLLLTVPELAHGHYWWELRATDAVGKVCRLLYGTLAALTSAEVARLAEEAEESSLRELAVEVGAGYAAPLILRWQACSAAASLAEDAARAAERAEAAADRAENAQENVLGKLSAAQAFMESFNTALQQAVAVVDNYLWVGGVNTGHYLKGEAGITPHIGTDGYWYVGVQRLGDRPAFGADGITPHITADGFWAFGELKTTVPAAGRDGIDGTAIRYILVGDYEDIPQSGDTCNGGFRYLVAKEEAWATVGNAEATVQGEWEALELPASLLPESFTHLRIPQAFNSNSTPAYLMARTTDGQILGVSLNAVTWAAGDAVAWEFAAPIYVSEGKTVQLFIRPGNGATTGAIPYEGILMKSIVEGAGSCRVRYHGTWYGSRTPYFQVFGSTKAEFYDVYAWVERTDGSPAGWLRVDKTNELATAQVYGVMKYATDLPIVGGAPVGQNAAGQACVPIAETALPGAVRPSSQLTDNSGGLTHVGEDARLYVDLATASKPGVGAASYSQTVENTGSVGLTADGKWAVPPAAAFVWGCVRAGTSVPQSNGMPWIIPVGMAAAGVHNEYGQDIRGQLMNNLLVGGALRTALKETWQGWAPNGINTSVLPDKSNAVGIMTSASFSQNAAEGLRLEPASTSLLGGVTLCESIGSGSGMVPTVQAVLTYVQGYAYGKSNVYTKQEVYSRTEIEDRESSNNSALAELYKTKAEAAQEHEQLQRGIQARMRKSPTVESVQVLTVAEYQALPQRDKTCIYFVTED